MTRLTPYVHETDADVADAGPAPHDGTGDAHYHRFFKDVDTALYLNRIVLPPGASVGPHLQKFDEIFYVLSGSGEMRIDDERFAVGPGSAVLTRGGQHHELIQVGPEALNIVVVHAGRVPARTT